ncbi:hypothetical protein MANES_11G111701v8 [Manihot esculenta]|uniref:Uncharacterized protein n=1 Tax=Manihot esculenta TaxID=3983 RepID=A0ACB7GVU6_MANES|nr:hypothetical protein MANES_11G111701v8 [Manihot esculenta]
MARGKQVSYGDHKTARKIYHEAQSESTAYFSASESEDVSDSSEVEVAHVQKHNGKGLVADLPFEIEELYIAQKWKMFSDIYRNIRVVDEQESFITTIQGKMVTITIDDLAQAFGLPNEGKSSWHEKKCLLYNEKAFKKSIFPEGTSKNEIGSSLLPQQYKILQKIVIYFLYPRTGSKGYMNEIDLCIMGHMVNKVPYNLSYLMFKIIVKDSKCRELSYSMQLTLFSQKLKIKLVKEIGYCNGIPIKEIFSSTAMIKRRCNVMIDKKVDGIEIDGEGKSEADGDNENRKRTKRDGEIGVSSDNVIIALAKENLEKMKEIKEAASFLKNSQDLQQTIINSQSANIAMLKIFLKLFRDTFVIFGDFGDYQCGTIPAAGGSGYSTFTKRTKSQARKSGFNGLPIFHFTVPENAITTKKKLISKVDLTKVRSGKVPVATKVTKSGEVGCKDKPEDI